MATGQLDGVVHYFRQLVQDAAGLSDGQLLERFRTHQDPAAFEGLVRRYGPMVLGVCRRVLRDRHDAEDAFQATFLVLLRKARSLARPELVGNWLYGTAYLTAQNARASRARRQAAERQVRDIPRAQPAANEVGSDLQPLLDEELSRLPGKFRIPFILCALEGKTREEAARQLSIPVGTLSGRLTTARRMLAKRLKQRGLVVSDGSFVAALSQGVASACVPASLIISTTKAATTIAASGAPATAVSAKVAALTEGVLEAMFITKLKTCLALAVVLVVGLASIGLVTHYGLAGPPETGMVSEAQPDEREGAHPATLATDDKQPSREKSKTDGAGKKSVGRISAPKEIEGHKAPLGVTMDWNAEEVRGKSAWLVNLPALSPGLLFPQTEPLIRNVSSQRRVAYLGTEGALSEAEEFTVMLVLLKKDAIQSDNPIKKEDFEALQPQIVHSVTIKRLR